MENSKAFAIDTQKRTCHLLADTEVQPVLPCQRSCYLCTPLLSVALIVDSKEEARAWIEVLQNVILRSRAESQIV